MSILSLLLFHGPSAGRGPEQYALGASIKSMSPLVRGLHCATPGATGPNCLHFNSASVPEFGNLGS